MILVLKGIGFWGDRWEWVPLPHPAELRHLTWEPTEKEKIVRYLKSGVPIGIHFEYSTCRFPDGPPDREMGCRDFTDGVWAWPEGLSIYVDRYDTMLPEAFRDHARLNQYRIPSESDFDDLELYQISVLAWVEWTARVRSNRIYATLSKFMLVVLRVIYWWMRIQ